MILQSEQTFSEPQVVNTDLLTRPTSPNYTEQAPTSQTAAVLGPTSRSTHFEVPDEPQLENLGETTTTQVPRSKVTRSRAYFKLLAQWEGKVTAVENGLVQAQMRELSDLTQPDEFAEFPLDEIEESEKAHVKPGSIFYFNVGYSISPQGQQRRTSYVKLRKLVPETLPRGSTAVRYSENFFTDK